MGSKMSKIALRGLSMSMRGPPTIRPTIEKPPKNINPVPNISIVHPFCVKIKIWWKTKPVAMNGNANVIGR